VAVVFWQKMRGGRLLGGGEEITFPEEVCIGGSHRSYEDEEFY
jgi:hypothetical protein